jgi:hypothetical protein
MAGRISAPAFPVGRDIRRTRGPDHSGLGAFVGGVIALWEGISGCTMRQSGSSATPIM